MLLIRHYIFQVLRYHRREESMEEIVFFYERHTLFKFSGVGQKFKDFSTVDKPLKVFHN